MNDECKINGKRQKMAATKTQQTQQKNTATVGGAVAAAANVRDKNRLQEKEDFQLAKLLQEYDNNAHSPTSNRNIRYALRSRSKASSSLSSSSSSIENFGNKFPLIAAAAAAAASTTKTIATNKNKNCSIEMGRTRSNNGTNKSILLGLNDQKLTRSRRLALTMTGA